MKCRASLLCAVCCIAWPGIHPAAAEESVPTVSASGTKSFVAPCHAMRLQIDLLARGETLAGALAALEERVKLAEARLKKLGAEPDSIKLGPPQTSSGLMDQQEQLQQMVRQRLADRGGRVAERLQQQAKPSVTVSRPLAAQWTLSGDGHDALLLAIETLQAQIRDGDLSGRKELEEGADEELAEQLAEAEMDPFGGDDGPQPGEPAYLFVSRFSAEQKQAARKAAFEAALRQAEHLASAAGRKLGPLRSLSGEESSAMSMMYQQLQYGGYGQGLEADMLQRAFDEDPDLQYNPTPAPARCRLTVHATFALE